MDRRICGELLKEGGESDEDKDRRSDVSAGERAILMKRQRTEHEIELVTEMVANIGSYVPSTVEGLQDKLADAQAAMNATTQEEIDAATATLREARLNARTKADVSALEELIAYAAALDMRGFTAQSAAEVIQAIEQGRLIARDPEATQEDVDIQLQALQSAIDGLRTAEKADGSADTAAAAQSGAMAALLLAAGGGAWLARKKQDD